MGCTQERNSLGGTFTPHRPLPHPSTPFLPAHVLTRTFRYVLAVKAVTAAQLSMASQNVYSVTLDEAIEAMRLTAVDMSVKYKETSLSVRIRPLPFSALRRSC